MVNEEQLEEEAKATATSYARTWGGTLSYRLFLLLILFLQILFSSHHHYLQLNLSQNPTNLPTQPQPT